MIVANYSTKVFDVTDIDAAKRIILTPEVGLTTEERWEKETPYLLDLMKNLYLKEGDTVLDFGSGIGRLSKELINKYNVTAVGLDISLHMRALAHVYVNDKRFFSVSPENIVPEFFSEKFDAVIAVWALQHVFDLPGEISRIKSVLKPGGKLFVVNERRRFVPTDVGWVDDSSDIFLAVQKDFQTININVMDHEVVTIPVADRTFWGVFTKAL